MATPLDQQLSALTPYARAFYTQCSAKANPIQALACLQQAMQMRPPAGMSGYEGTGSLTDGVSAGRVLGAAAVFGTAWFLWKRKRR
jgi:hypothetical protein